jgi:large subunit ribosomal protein L6
VSRIGRKPVQIPKGVTVTLKDGVVSVKGPKGILEEKIHSDISVEVKEQQILLSRKSDETKYRALHGKLEIVGVGYRAEMKGTRLNLLLGYSHPILFGAPEGIKIEAPTQTSILISGVHKQLVGLVAAKIRSFRPPEPYKGKGVKYEGEYIRRKAGKAAAAAAK